jgi:hypothetical protein
MGSAPASGVEVGVLAGVLRHPQGFTVKSFTTYPASTALNEFSFVTLVLVSRQPVLKPEGKGRAK